MRSSLLLVSLLLGSALGSRPLAAQSRQPGAPGMVTPVPVGMTALRREAVASPVASSHSAWAQHRVPTDSVTRARRRAFHIGALSGAVLTGTVAGVAVARSGDPETGDPERGAIVGVAAVAAVIGALLGGVAGVIVHDVAGAVTGP